jgi:hypothetical protein
MKNAKAFALLGAVAITGAANAAEITVGDPAPGVQAADIISGPGITTWSAGNTYNLLDQIYVEDGADLVIEAGVIIASQDAISTQRGSLAVSPGGQIFVQGTAENPVIMTSYSDVRTWTGASFVGQPDRHGSRLHLRRRHPRQHGHLRRRQRGGDGRPAAPDR